jgi:hypothetical protein
VTLPIISRLRSLYFRWFSQPSHNRLLYREICRRRVRTIVELGVGSGQRAVRMIELARRGDPSAVYYVGMDQFEAQQAGSGPGMTLKAAHQLLRGAGARFRLVPGDPAEGLIQSANSLGQVDLLIVPGELDSAEWARFWYFVPRVLHERSLVLIDGRTADGGGQLQPKARGEIERLAATGSGRRAA